MREYELTYLVSDEVLEKDLKNITDKISGFISAEGGKISKEEIWGRRKLAYPISKQNFATYITAWFEVDKDKLADIEHELRIYPLVIRHLITVKIAKEEELKVTKEDIVGAKDVEEVIGKKSFEVVEGETESSKDLMAVREKEKDSELKKPEGETAKDKEDLAKKALIKEEKEVLPTKKKAKSEKTKDSQKADIDEEVKEEKKAKKIAKKVKAKTKPKKKEDEVDRIKKLDEKLDELLGDDL